MTRRSNSKTKVIKPDQQDFDAVEKEYGPLPPTPHDVAGAIADLIATPKGARAARLVVGQAFGADAVNDAVAPIQHRVLLVRSH